MLVTITMKKKKRAISLRVLCYQIWSGFDLNLMEMLFKTLLKKGSKIKNLTNLDNTVPFFGQIGICIRSKIIQNVQNFYY